MGAPVLGIFALAFGLSSPPSFIAERAVAAEVETVGPVRIVQASFDTRVPTDLLPELIPLPPLPEPRHDERKPSTLETLQESFDMAALKVDRVAFHRPAPVRVALGLPGAPETLLPGSVNLEPFGNSGRSTSGDGEWGWVELGFGGGGIGRVNAGTCARNPAFFR